MSTVHVDYSLKRFSREEEVLGGHMVEADSFVLILEGRVECGVCWERAGTDGRVKRGGQREEAHVPEDRRGWQMDLEDAGRE